MALVVFLVVLVQAVFPLLCLIWLWFGASKRRVDWILKSLAAGSFFLDLFLTGRWDWLGYVWRLLLPALFVAGIPRAFRRARALPWSSWMSWPEWLKNAGALLLLVYFSLHAIRAALGQAHPRERTVDLDFPLRQGLHYVGQGGASSTINHHHAFRPQRFALDITRLDGLGRRAKGFYPKDLRRYEIFEKPLYAPCSGEVLTAADGLEDSRPPAKDPMHPAGNHVVLECGAARVTLAHIRKGSVGVRVGQRVTTGEAIGRVGNSGNTTEPHLHIHAEDGVGKGVPMTFGGRFLVRNSLYRAD